MPTASRNVGFRGQSGKHLLTLSFSGFDPNRTNYDQRVGLKLLQLELLGAKARGLAIA
jgi:hypothetical protein